ncbi:MAG: hypothetical protein ABUT20_25870 [Bacteroidota bacterium]
MTNETNEPNHQKDVISDYASELQQIEMEGYERAVKKARNALFWAGGLYFFWEMIGMFRSEGGFNLPWFIVAVIEAGIFIALALWTKTKPYTAVIIGLVYFIGLIILGVIVYAAQEGSGGIFKAIFSGIIVKVIIIVNLVLPIKDAKALQEAKKNMIK